MCSVFGIVKLRRVLYQFKHKVPNFETNITLQYFCFVNFVSIKACQFFALNKPIKPNFKYNPNPLPDTH